MLDLFAYAEVRKLPTPDMHRKRDRDTAIQAACGIAKCKTDLQAEVLAAFVKHGAMTDGEMEALPQFADWKPSTARKRRGELRDLGLIEDTGEVRKCGRSSMTVWKAVV
jgi:hypothetical protein